MGYIGGEGSLLATRRRDAQVQLAATEPGRDDGCESGDRVSRVNDRCW